MLRVTLIALSLFAGTALVAAPAACEKKAQAAVLKKFGSYFYYGGRRIRQIETTDCKRLTSKAGSPYYACEVGASTGEGAGDVLFKALVDSRCTKAFSTFLVYEE
jgi:hypothetical protein